MPQDYASGPEHGCADRDFSNDMRPCACSAGKNVKAQVWTAAPGCSLLSLML